MSSTYPVGCPKVLRVDKGTENVYASTAQIALRLHHEDAMSGSKSVIAGASVHNVVRDIQIAES